LELFSLEEEATQLPGGLFVFAFHFGSRRLAAIAWCGVGNRAAFSTYHLAYHLL